MICELLHMRKREQKEGMANEASLGFVPGAFGLPVPIPFDVLTINEDKTCVIDGVNASWRFSTMYGNASSALEIEILVEGNRFCGAVLQDMGLMAVTENLALCATTHCKKPQ
jgi:hypothetical protein